MCLRYRLQFPDADLVITDDMANLGDVCDILGCSMIFFSTSILQDGMVFSESEGCIKKIHESQNDWGRYFL